MIEVKIFQASHDQDYIVCAISRCRWKLSTTNTSPDHSSNIATSEMTSAEFKDEISKKTAYKLRRVLLRNARYIAAGIFALVFLLSKPSQTHDAVTLILESAGMLAFAYGVYMITLFLKSRRVVIINTGLDFDQNRKLAEAVATSFGWTFIRDISYMEYIGGSAAFSDFQYTVLLLIEPNQIHMHLQQIHVNADIFNKRAKLIRGIDTKISEGLQLSALAGEEKLKKA